MSNNILSMKGFMPFNASKLTLDDCYKLYERMNIYIRIFANENLSTPIIVLAKEDE